MTSAITFLADAPKLAEPVASGTQLILAFLAGIAVIVVLITVVKLHPFLGLIFGALTVGVVAGENLTKVLKSFTDGFGTTAAGVGILIALGAMFAKLLADSGGADEIVDTIVGHASPRMLPWAMALVGRDHRPADVLRDRPGAADAGDLPGGPALATVVDHRRNPGPGRPVRDARFRAAAPRTADRGRTAQRRPRRHAGVSVSLVAIPTIIVAGPLFGKLAGKWVVVEAPHTFDADRLRRRRRTSPAVIRRHAVLGAAAGRADDGQGDRRYQHRGREPVVPADLRQPGHADHRTADRRDRRHVHAGPRGRNDARRRSPRPSSRGCPRWPASS